MEWPDVVDLYEYWEEYPPTHVILKLLHLKPKSKAPQSMKEAMDQMRQLTTVMGSGTSPLPPHLRRMAEFALEQSEKMNRARRN
jgi:hypothetical protein